MKTKSKNRSEKLKLTFAIVLICLAAFILVSIFSYQFLKQRAIGIIGKYIGGWLVFGFNYGAYIIGFLILIFAIVILGNSWLKQHFGLIFIWLIGIYLFSCFIAFALGVSSVFKNYGGYWGTIISSVSFKYLGLFITFFVPLFLLFGLIPYLKSEQKKSYLRNSLVVFLILILIQLTINFFIPKSYWHNFHFLIGGILSYSIIKAINYLTGWWGNFVVIIGMWLIVILYYTHIFSYFKTPVRILFNFIKLIARVFLSIIKWIYRLVVTPSQKKTKSNSKVIELPQNKIQEPSLFEQSLKPIIVTDKATPSFKVKSESKKPILETRFDEQAFQNEFLSCLDTPPQEKMVIDEKELKQEAELLIEKLKEFGIDCKVSEILTGPMITRFELEPAPGIKIQRIENLADDLALSLKAERIRILAPIPGKAAVGIEVPNKDRRLVYLRDVLTSEEYTSKTSPLTFALGETITGESYVADLREMPHVLIAGTTGSGKSVCINTMISSIIFRSSQKEVRFLTIDPKQLELPVYNPIPHLLNTTTTDPKHAIKELDRIIAIMEARYGIFANLGVRDIAGYNQIAPKEGLEKKPYIVVVIDELADLMIRAPTEIEEKITRLAQMSRAVGIHLVLATQRPSVDVITGLIKANFPCRIAFQVASKTDSRTILDMNGAEALLGRGDMLFLPPGKGEPIRLHCAYVSAQATRKIVDLWTTRYLTERLEGLVDNPAKTAQALVTQQVVDILIDREKASLKRKQEVFYSILSEDVAEKLWQEEYHKPLSEELDMPKISKSESENATREIDELFEKAARIVFHHREASVSMLQRRLDVGWARAGRIIDQLEQVGIVGPYVGSKSRKVLIQSEEELEKILATIRSSGQQPK